jgi:hypothetical protein
MKNGSGDPDPDQNVTDPNTGPYHRKLNFLGKKISEEKLDELKNWHWSFLWSLIYLRG